MSPTMRQHLDTGGVQVEVTRITNGSVVVEFNLLVVTDLDVQEVSAAFLAAFQNASLLGVAGGDAFIGGRWRSGLTEAHRAWDERPESQLPPSSKDVAPRASSSGLPCVR